MRKRIGKAGYKGVTKAGKKWAATISVKNVASYPSKATHDRIYLGTYDTPEKAYIARCQWLDKLK